MRGLWATETVLRMNSIPTMSAAEAKSNLHRIVDRIEDERLLRVICDFLEEREKSNAGQLLKTLSQDQQQEVLRAYEESEQDHNLIEDKDVWGRLK